MTLSFDPERNEIDAFLEFADDLQDRRVLEIGAGSGRLTWRYAAQASQVLGIDPKAGQVARALEEAPPQLLGRVTFLEHGIEEYQQVHQGAPFDIALMSWSL
jgi:cyclopropane fatty-acyl-phospholipid synthase-like methyltransferase